MAAPSAIPATSKRAAGTNCDAPVSRLNKHTLETTNEYHIPPPGFNPA